nr:hypothetical protein [Streptomyces piniterrae]
MAGRPSCLAATNVNIGLDAAEVSGFTDAAGGPGCCFSPWSALTRAPW